MNNLYMSDGLDVDFGDQIQLELLVNVTFGKLRGTLHTVRLGDTKRLEFYTKDIEAALTMDPANVTKFRLEFNKKIYDFSLEPYNYTLTPVGDGIVVAVEEYSK